MQVYESACAANMERILTTMRGLPGPLTAQAIGVLAGVIRHANYDDQFYAGILLTRLKGQGLVVRHGTKRHATWEIVR